MPPRRLSSSCFRARSFLAILSKCSLKSPSSRCTSLLPTSRRTPSSWSSMSRIWVLNFISWLRWSSSSLVRTSFNSAARPLLSFWASCRFVCCLVSLSTEVSTPLSSLDWRSWSSRTCSMSCRTREKDSSRIVPSTLCLPVGMRGAGFAFPPFRASASGGSGGASAGFSPSRNCFIRPFRIFPIMVRTPLPRYAHCPEKGINYHLQKVNELPFKSFRPAARVEMLWYMVGRAGRSHRQVGHADFLRNGGRRVPARPSLAPAARAEVVHIVLNRSLLCGDAFLQRGNGLCVPQQLAFHPLHGFGHLGHPPEMLRELQLKLALSVQALLQRQDVRIHLVEVFLHPGIRLLPQRVQLLPEALLHILEMVHLRDFPAKLLTVRLEGLLLGVCPLEQLQLLVDVLHVLEELVHVDEALELGVHLGELLGVLVQDLLHLQDVLTHAGEALLQRRVQAGRLCLMGFLRFRERLFR